MGVSHGRSRVADLMFQVFSRSVHPDWFAVRAHRRLTLEGWEADLRIIEGGHAVVFRSGRVRLTALAYLADPYSCAHHAPGRRWCSRYGTGTRPRSRCPAQPVRNEEAQVTAPRLA